MYSKTIVALTAAIVFLALVAQAQLDFPDCVSQCVDQSTDNSCSITDIKCICRESNGRFLPDLVLCIHGACDPSLNIDQLLSPLVTVCSMIGTPLSDTAINNAEQEASSLALQATVTETVTQISGNVAPTPVGPQTASTNTNGQPQTVVTITATSNAASTSTQTVASTTVFTDLIPVIIVGTDSAGSVFTTTTTEPGALSTITTTDSVGSTETVVSTFTQPGSSASQSSSPSSPAASSSSGGSTAGGASGGTSASSTTTATTSIAAESTTGSFATSATSQAPNPDSTNSSPFDYQNAAAHKDHAGTSLKAMAISLVFVGIWL